MSSRPYPGPQDLNGAGPNRLTHVAERFSQFYNDLESEKQSRREAEEQRRHNVVDQVNKLERNLESEIKRRMEADKALSVRLDTELKAMHDKQQVQMRELHLSVNASIDALSRTFAELHQHLREEKDQRQQDLEHATHTLLAKVDDTQAALDDERVARLEREAHTLKRVGEDIFRVQEKLDMERVEREAATAQVQSEMRELVGNRSGAEDNFQAVVLAELANLKSALQCERDERITEDEQIVHAINDYTQAMQDGLRLAVRN
eukprot:CAMPEP_0196578060 /NCGR_PEP_ID=MMETSP1081-20130531/7035_1 /TAXON_ID=36882 /ORGANISM="Pyramimonas amylifera, Strain CCMP720" /LENGTH=261 /DNA_ID=CAMNT_0041897169 /DNA_START=335 /DNA_END=1120 /DNA_ORIENTATION=+